MAELTHFYFKPICPINCYLNGPKMKQKSIYGYGPFTLNRSEAIQNRSLYLRKSSTLWIFYSSRLMVHFHCPTPIPIPFIVPIPVVCRSAPLGPIPMVIPMQSMDTR